MLQTIKKDLQELLKEFGVTGDIELVVPPTPEMGDLSFACFAYAKQQKENPAAVATALQAQLVSKQPEIVERIEVTGPYVNFFLKSDMLAKRVVNAIDETYGQHDSGINEKWLVEYGCPNPMKAFHLGHLRNLISGESVARILENAGYNVVRTNYQGDVGMQIAKTLWGIDQLKSEFESVQNASTKEKVEFLGRAYAHGATAYEESDEMQNEIREYNEVVYGERKDARITDIYTEARQWSLDYFDSIYTKLGSHYHCFYFESEMFARAIEIVNEHKKDGTFVDSDGAVIFPGSEYGLHDRVFLNSKGYPTYESKELALAERHLSEHHPDRVVHVVGKEQTEYFKVVFEAMKHVVPEMADKEMHLVGGYLQLKGEQKMSSRKGTVITGDALIEAVESRVAEVMQDTEVADAEHVKNAVTVAALKYTMLKVQVSKDIAFDMETSVSTSGDSGPYLLYIVARIKSILKKAKIEHEDVTVDAVGEIVEAEKKLVMKLAQFPEVTAGAARDLDASKVAHYLFDLAQAFNSFYDQCSVLGGDDEVVHNFRLVLIQKIETVMTHGLYLLGIETVEEM